MTFSKNVTGRMFFSTKLKQPRKDTTDTVVYIHIAKPLLTVAISISFKIFPLHLKCHSPIFSKIRVHKKLERTNW